MTKDLTEGKPARLIFDFALPVLGGYIFQQLYNVADTIIVGKCLSVEDLAAVGSTGSVSFLILGFCMGISSGFAIPVAQCFGSKNYTKMRQYIYNAIILTAVFSIVYAVATVILCHPLLKLMQTPYDIIDHASDYIIIIFAGIPFGFLYNLSSGILRSLGDSKTPLYFLLFSSVLNIFLDLACILIFKMGIRGAAIATVISQGVSGILCIFYIKKKYNLLIGERTAEEIKIKIGSAYPQENEKSMVVKGRNLIDGLPKDITITTEEVRDALADPLSTIIEAIKTTLEKTPPELSADIIDHGIMLTGGGALLKGIDMLVMQQTGMPVHIADRPLDCVVDGAGKRLVKPMGTQYKHNRR